MLATRFKLVSDYEIPALGFGTWKLSDETARRAVTQALKTGYRHIDTADAYGNHREVGRAMAESGLSRGEIFLTTKVWRDQLRPRAVSACVERFLHELGTDYLDLLLVHWPNHAIPIAETLDAFVEARRQGKVRSIGVSNFTVPHLEQALMIKAPIAVNQVEFHPSLNQRELKTFCDERGIVLTAYSPIGRGADLKLPTIQALAQKYKRSESQIILNWLIAKGIVAIPKAADPQHIEENFKTLEFSLTPDDIASIDAIVPNTNRLINPPFAEFGGPFEKTPIRRLLSRAATSAARWLR